MPVKLTKEEFIRRAKLIYGDYYDYSKVVYIDSKTKIIIICPVHGEFKQLPDSHLKGNGCWECGIKKRSISNSTTQVEYINKLKSKYINLNFDKTNFKHSRKKLIVTCLKHGDFYQRADLLLLGHGCKKCSNDIRGNKLSKIHSSNKEEFIEKAKSIHGKKYDYSKIVYINSWTKVCIICPDHGEFWQTPNAHISQKQGCPICKSSKGEETIKAILNKHNIVSIREWKHPDEKYLFEYDFYLPELNILIEFHGRQHYEWVPYFHKTYHDFEEQCKRDSWKMTLAKTKCIPLLEFNYKQLTYLSAEQFENFVINSLNKWIKNLGIS